MKKKLLAVGCSGNTSMLCCHKDAQVMYNLHCTDMYTKRVATTPDVWEGTILAKPVISLDDLMPLRETLYNVDLARIFWSSHGTKIKIKNKKEFAFYTGNGTVILFRDFIDYFVGPILDSGTKHVELLLDTCYSGSAKRSHSQTRSIVAKGKEPFEEKYIELYSPTINKLTGKKSNKKNITIISAASNNQSALGNSTSMVGYPFTVDTDGCSLWTYNIISAIVNAYGWAEGYEKDNWGYALKLERKRTKAAVLSTGLSGWLNSQPKTVVPVSDVKGKLSKVLL